MIIDDHWVIFGHRYKEGALIAEPSSGTEDTFENPRTTSGRPGSRAPHLFLERRGTRISTLDLFDGHWVLLTGVEGGGWIAAASKLPAAKQFPLNCYRIGQEGDLQDPSRRWNALYGVNERGTVLVRPDGFIAWREPEGVSSQDAILREILDRLSFKDQTVSALVA
jgi:putative polyketide hydroxylase